MNAVSRPPRLKPRRGRQPHGLATAVAPSQAPQSLVPSRTVGSPRTLRNRPPTGLGAAVMAAGGPRPPPVWIHPVRRNEPIQVIDPRYALELRPPPTRFVRKPNTELRTRSRVHNRQPNQWNPRTRPRTSALAANYGPPRNRSLGLNIPGIGDINISAGSVDMIPAPVRAILSGEGITNLKGWPKWSDITNFARNWDQIATDWARVTRLRGLSGGGGLGQAQLTAEGKSQYDRAKPLYEFLEGVSGTVKNLASAGQGIYQKIVDAWNLFKGGFEQAGEWAEGVVDTAEGAFEAGKDWVSDTFFGDPRAFSAVYIPNQFSAVYIPNQPLQANPGLGLIITALVIILILVAVIAVAFIMKMIRDMKLAEAGFDPTRPPGVDDEFFLDDDFLIDDARRRDGFPAARGPEFVPGRAGRFWFGNREVLGSDQQRDHAQDPRAYPVEETPSHPGLAGNGAVAETTELASDLGQAVPRDWWLTPGFDLPLVPQAWEQFGGDGLNLGIWAIIILFGLKAAKVLFF